MNTIETISRFCYFVGRTKNVHDYRFVGLTITKDNDKSDTGTVSGFCKKDEILVVHMKYGFTHIEFEDALTFLATMN